MSFCTAVIRYEFGMKLSNIPFLIHLLGQVQSNTDFISIQRSVVCLPRLKVRLINVLFAQSLNSCSMQQMQSETALIVNNAAQDSLLQPHESLPTNPFLIHFFLSC